MPKLPATCLRKAAGGSPICPPHGSLGHADFEGTFFIAPREAYAAVMEEAGLENGVNLAADRSRLFCAGGGRGPMSAPTAVRTPSYAATTFWPLVLTVACADLGIRVGEDVLLIGCDGVEETRSCPAR